MDDLALLDRAGHIATLRLNRPESHNALSIELLSALHARLDELEAVPPRVLVVTGEGRSFCAGMDLRQVLSTPEAPRTLLESLARFTLRLRTLPCVTVARVNGAAIGGGCGLVCVCDFALSFADNKMGFPEVDLGVCPAVVAPWVVRRVGHGPARRILLEGGTFTGRRAHELGLVTSLSETREELDAATELLVSKIAQGGPKAQAATKGLLNDLDPSVDEALLLRAAGLSASILATPEAQASLRARLKT